MLQEDERQALLIACDESKCPALGLLVRTALATGARKGELLKLTWSDIDLIEKTVHFKDTKNKDDRKIFLIADIHERLIKWKKENELGLVFPRLSKTNKPVNLDPIWNRAKDKACIENFRFHDLRHSTGSYLARAGASAFQIAAILGHRSGPSMSARYVHLESHESSELLGAALGGKL